MIHSLSEALSSIDIGMTMEKDAAVSAACGGSAYELRFNHHGSLPGTFVFRVNAEGASPGDTVYLYYLNEETGTFEGVHAAVVDGEGYVSLYISHCSSYYITDTIIESAENSFATPAPAVTAAPEAKLTGMAAFVRGDAVLFWVCIYVLVCGAAAVITLFIRRRKRDKADTAIHTLKLKTRTPSGRPGQPPSQGALTPFSLRPLWRCRVCAACRSIPRGRRRSRRRG